MRGIVETAVMTAALVLATTWSAGSTAAAMVDNVAGNLAGGARAIVDRARLPIGDGKVSTSPTVGSVYACQTRFNGGGAFTNGPWIKNDGTFDYSSKAIVDGDVSWPSQFTVSLNGSTRTFSGNDLPSHTTGVYPIAQSDDAYRYDRNPNSIKSQTMQFSLPANPTVASQPSCAPGGPIGVLLSGSVVFNALDAAGNDAVAHEAQDHCQGHPERTGVYHYHNLTGCLDDSGSSHSPLMGYAFDGFGIYGHHGEDGAELTNADLDACHGHTHTITWDGQSVELYHYHATQEYPYTIGCFAGTPNRQAMAGGGLESGQGPGGPVGGPGQSGGTGAGGPGGPVGQQGPGQGQGQRPFGPPPGGGSEDQNEGQNGSDGQFPPPPPPGRGPRGGEGAGGFGPPPPPR